MPGFGQATLAPRIDLPNGWHLTPIGNSIQLGDLPLNIAVSPDGRMAAVTNNGESDQSIELIDVATQKVTDSVRIDKSWLGLAFSANGAQLYASGGNDNKILEYDCKGGKLRSRRSYILGKPWPVKVSPTGLAVDSRRNRIYTVTKEDSSLYILDLQTTRMIKKISLGAEAYTCVLSADGKTLYISIWGGEGVAFFETGREAIAATVRTGGNPNDICLSPDGRLLYVANALDNSVSVVDVAERNVVETLDAAVYPGSLEGSTTNSVALSKDGKTLWVANADNNCLAVFDVTKPGSGLSKGFIPAGWYPTCVRVIGNNIWVANGKGFQSAANPLGPNPYAHRDTVHYRKDAPHPNSQYIGGLFRGTMSIIPAPDDKTLAEYSRLVYANTPYNREKETRPGGRPGNPIPSVVGQASPIKHVFYVIKENRTYDQVLGDNRRGNGDSSLCLFPANVTPNEHALADEFVLLDNFYVDAEVSADGHNWSMAAYANDYTEKTWPTEYGGRGGEYDYGGDRKIAFPKNGFIWDDCLRHNVTLRNYGEFSEDSLPPLPDLARHTYAAFPGWNLSIQDTLREKRWEHDFDSLAASGAVPQLSIVYFPNDHTSGLQHDAYTPFAAVADNDLALGKFVDHLSHSPVWNESAVFVLEDDAQNGPDHVDAHRSTAYLAGGYVRRGYVDHTPYSTSCMIHTMELILGLPPMSQYDAAGLPMWRCFSDTLDPHPYTARIAKVNLSDRNIAMNGPDKKDGEDFDLAHADAIPDLEFSRVIWRAVRGASSEMPPVRHAAFVHVTSRGADDEPGD